MSKCPDCGSSDIIPELDVLTTETSSGNRPAFVKLIEPELTKRPFMWMAQEVKSYFKATICGNCGYTQFHTTFPDELWQAHQKGFIPEA